MEYKAHRRASHSTADLGGGQESVYMSTVTTLVHRGFIYVPLGFARAFLQLSNLTEVHGGKLIKVVIAITLAYHLLS
jgi:hypothetical protein